MEGRVSLLLLSVLLGVYSLLFVLCCYRVRKIQGFSHKWKHTRLFYASILAQLLLRVWTFALILLAIPKTNHEAHRALFLLISLPDSFFLVSYYLVALQMLSVFYFSHMENDLLASLIIQFTRPRHQEETRATGVLIVIWVIIQTAAYILYLLTLLDDSDITLEVSLVNVTSATGVLMMLIMMFNKFSSTPLRSNFSRGRLSVISKRVILWTFGRLLKGSLDLYWYERGLVTVNAFILASGNWVVWGIILGTLVVSEILCYITVIDFNFMDVFLFNEHDENSRIKPYLNKTLIVNEEASTVVNTENPIIDIEHLTLAAPLLSRPHALGAVIQGSYQGRPAAVRELIFERISGYILEDTQVEVTNLMKLSPELAMPLLGMHVDGSKLLLVHLFSPGGSLFTRIHQERETFSGTEKLFILKSLAFALKNLHALGLYHGHLTSHNVFLDEKLNARVSDIGLHKLKKYAGIILGYTNKSAWSSPQQLSELAPVAQKPKGSDDVYSWAVIGWELCAEREPPVVWEALPADVPVGLTKLLRGCVAPDPRTRLSIFSVCSDIAGIKWR